MEHKADTRQDVWPRVCVFILNYNGKNHLEYCLPSLSATDYANYELVLLDNNSDDDSVEFTRVNFPHVTIVQNDGNLGWAAGNNVGIRYALDHGADYIVLQNNDTKVDPRWLSGAVQVCEENPRVGIVGFNMLQEYIQGEDPDEERFGALSAAWEKLEYEPADHVTGAALFVRADVFHDVGLIDEAYFAYSEEDDLEKRAVRAGYQMVRINVPLWHYNGGFWRKRFLKSSMLAMRNNIRCMLKNDMRDEVWRQIEWLVHFVCPPRVEFDERIPHFRRLRPSNFIVNSAILAYALLWNLVFLPATLRVRRESEQRIIRAQQRWKSQAV
jgi:GT2 family glycosyltransferase